MRKNHYYFVQPQSQGQLRHLCDEFARGAVEPGHTAGKLFLKSMSIGYCIGCGYCVNHCGIEKTC